MDRPDANRTFENNHGNSDVPTNMNDDFITEVNNLYQFCPENLKLSYIEYFILFLQFSPATSSAIDTLLDFIFNEDSNSSTSSDSTISEEPRGNPSANHNIGVSY